MKSVFADTCYWIAILNPKDEIHEKAKSVSKALDQVITITSEMVLTELLNDKYFRKQIMLRKAAVEFIKQQQENPNVKIIAQTSIQFNEAVSLYAKRADKNWSLTDCASFQIMEKEGISEALTYDKNFEQAGFIALLREK